ncbi:MAG: hypothetical protein ACN4GG_04955 [Akkermansiaceae bacterium]
MVGIFSKFHHILLRGPCKKSKKVEDNLTAWFPAFELNDECFLGSAWLKAMISIAPNTFYYNDERSSGLVRHPGGSIGEDIDLLFDVAKSGDLEKRDEPTSNYDSQNPAAKPVAFYLSLGVPNKKG